MTDITKYTTVEAVRAALGVTVNEVPNSFLLDQNMDQALLLNLASVLPDYASLTGTALKQLRMYSLWFCAALLARMWLAFPEDISDGKAKISRFDLDLEKLAENAEAMRDGYLDVLLPEETDDTYGYTAISLARPDWDPITNTET